MDANSSSEPAPAGKASLWRRPITWIVSATLAAVAIWPTTVVVSYLNAKLSAEDLGERLADPDLVKVIGMQRLLEVDGRRGYVVAPGSDPRPMTQVAAGSGPDDDRRVDAEVERQWVQANRAVDLEATAWQLTLEGNRTDPVVISDIRPVQIECGPPLTGGLVDLGQEGEGDKVALEADIEAVRPSFTRINAEDGQPEQRDYFSQKYISLERDEKVVLILIGRTNSKHCTWRYRITFVDGSPTGGSQIVSAPGNQPFEATGRLEMRRDTADEYAWVVPSASLWRCDPDGPMPVVKGGRFRDYVLSDQGFCL